MKKTLSIICILLATALLPRVSQAAPGDTLKISRFDVDATPPPGTWLVYDKMLNS